MKTSLVLFFALILSGPLGAQDSDEDSSNSQETMENADMSDGTTHWHGDCKAAGADESTDFITNQSSLPKGIVVDLHSTSWTKVTQEIHKYKSRGGGMVLTIVYQVSPDFKLSTVPSDYSAVAAALGFGGANLFGSMGKIKALIDSPPDSRTSVNSSGNFNTVTVYYDKVAQVDFAPKTDAQAQTFTTPINPPMGTQDDNPTFCLAFPPGSGSVTITKISLMPGRPGMPFPQNHP